MLWLSVRASLQRMMQKKRKPTVTSRPEQGCCQTKTPFLVKRACPRQASPLLPVPSSGLSSSGWVSPQSGASCWPGDGSSSGVWLLKSLQGPSPAPL